MGDSQEDGRRGNEVPEYVHVFQVADKTAMPVRTWRQTFWQLFPTFCASLTLVPFGIMLGWPAPTFPYLLEPTSEIPITLSQSAMTCGFLLLGLSIATPISSKYHLGPKYGIFIGLVFITIGWIILWYSKNILWLFGSRFVIGLGSAYAMGQVKNYTKDMCEPVLAQRMMKQLNFHGFFGLIIAYTAGNFLDFRTFPLVPMVISLVVLFITTFLPCTPKDFIRSKKMDEAVALLDFLRGKRDHSGEISRIQNELVGGKSDFIVPVIRNKELRCNFFKFVALVILQQFSGAPPLLVYSQVIFIKTGCPYPEYATILYAIVLFTSSIYGVFYSPKFNKKYVLVISSITTSILLSAQISILYFEVYRSYSFVILILFVAFYCKGIGSLPVFFIAEWFPEKYRQGVSDVYQIGFFMSALVSTKIFQVLFTAYPMYVGFCMFLVADLVLLFFVFVFVKTGSKSFIQANKVYFMNESMRQIDKMAANS